MCIEYIKASFQKNPAIPHYTIGDRATAIKPKFKLFSHEAVKIDSTNGKLCGSYAISEREGILYSSGGVMSVWFTNKQEQEAKQILKEHLMRRANSLEKSLTRTKALISQLD